jgi:hypothetical protein
MNLVHNRCLLTEKQVQFQPNDKGWWYQLQFEDKTWFIQVPFSFTNGIPKLVWDNRHILVSLFWQDKIKKGSNSLDLEEENVEHILMNSNYPKTTKERLDNLLVHIYKMQDFDGYQIGFDITARRFLSYETFFKTTDEMLFYLRTLKELDFIELKELVTTNYIYVYLTYKGLEYLTKISNEGQSSNNCFIAMSFSSEHYDIYSNGIYPALDATGFNPIRVDAVHIDSERTINDEIIASLKRSKFCIADFTGNKSGVYFESGYALGRGQKVIYTCHKDEIEKLHFDLKHNQFILYDNTEELRIALINKIEAWIKP